jgi:hypothetical protein
LLREPRMRRLLLVNWLLASCWDVHTFVVPVLGHERAFSASIGAILGAFAIAAAAVRVAMPLLAAHLREWVVVSWAMVITGLLFAIYPLMVSPWTMGPVLGTAGAGPGLGAAHDHEHAAPDHPPRAARSGAGAAAGQYQPVQRADAHAVWHGGHGGGRVRGVLDGGCRRGQPVRGPAWSSATGP